MTREKMTSRMKGPKTLLRGLALACAALVGGAAVAAPSAAALNKLEITCDADKGKVSGAGNYAVGKKVTIKATAAKGFVFAGWYYVEGGRLDGDIDSRTPTYPYVMPSDDTSLFAKFVKEADDDAQLSIRINGEDVSSRECKPKVAIPPVLLDVSDCISLPTVKVTGLPPGLKFTAKKLLNRDGTVLAEANTIYGTPTKSGVYTTTVTVTTATKKTATETFSFVVIDRVAKLERVLKIVADASRGKVTGAGVYAYDTKVTLKATPNKGFLFAGWYTDPSFTSPLAGSVDHRTLAFPYMTVGFDTSIYAKFIPAAEDKARLTAHLDGEDEEVAEVTSKPKEEIGPVVFDLSGCASLPTVKVAGLPPGLKFTAKRLFNRDGDIIAKANTIYGAPTKSGVYATAVTVTTAGKKTATKAVTFVVVDSTKGERVLRIKCDADGCKVSGAGVYAPGKKVTLKATPAKGYVFSGWHYVEGGRLDGDIDSRTPTYPYVMPSDDTSLFARFIKEVNDDAQLLVRVDGEDVDKYECAPNEAIRPIVLDAYYSTSLPTVKVTGLPPGLKFTAKKLLNRDGSVLAEANTIYGTPTKSGVYETILTVTTAGKSKLEQRFPIAVDNLASANERLLVKNTSGSAVALKNARGEKYTVYAGVSEHDLPAITVNDSADKLTLAGLPTGLKFTAKKLLNRDGSVLAEANTIYGVPTKAGFYTVTATVRSGRDSYVSTFTIEVVAIPEWAIGTFVGTGNNYEIEPYATDKGNLYWTFTVAANGKISGKAIFDTLEDRVLTATFSTPSLRKYDKETEKYYCDINLVFKDKGKVVHEDTRKLTISAEDYEYYESDDEPFGAGGESSEPQAFGYAQFSAIGEEFRNCAYQNVWKVKGFKNLPQFAARKTVCSKTLVIHGYPEVSGTSTLTLEIAQNGTVNATLVSAGEEGGKKFSEKSVAKGDLIIWAYAPEAGVYGADVCLVFGNMGLLVVEVEMKKSADGTIKDTGCEITDCTDFADWSY